MNRLKELDFLRGIAILLVLLRHQFISKYTYNMGWIGVDLFFVLSGFLVSGLLFKEYSKSGNVRPKRFLIRRGFKIYPIYFLFYPLYLIPYIIDHTLSLRGVLSEISFTQNYIYGWGYAFGAGWSLAIEEHFYFGFSILLWWGLRAGKINLNGSGTTLFKKDSFETVLLLLMALCLLFRIASNLIFPYQFARHFTMTHLRIDSLLAGVLIAYLYYYKLHLLTTFFNGRKKLLFVTAILGLCWTPFIDPVSSFFVRTFGFTILYYSFSILLLYFILEPRINQQLNNIFTGKAVRLIAATGLCSYSIYIIHPFINYWYDRFFAIYTTPVHRLLNFLATSFISIIIGMLMTRKIEHFFLTIRDKHYPSQQ